MAQLSKQQEYLLSRIPRWYDVEKKEEAEPAEVIKARKTIEVYTEKTGKARKAREVSFNKSATAAREAIYFRDAVDALEILKKLEAEFGCKK